MRVREITPQDLEPLARLLWRCNRSYDWAGPDWEPPAPSDTAPLTDKLFQPGFWARLTESEGQLAGLVGGQMTQEPAHLSWLFVDPACWRRGWGRRLLALAEAEMRARGRQQALLWVPVANRDSRAFYERCGWQDSAERRLHPALGLEMARYQRRL